MAGSSSSTSSRPTRAVTSISCSAASASRSPPSSDAPAQIGVPSAVSLLTDPLPNHFRRRLLERQRLIGCWASLASPISTEVLGYAGFDWLLLDGEHAPNDFQTFLTQLLALKDSSSAAVVRPQWNDPVLLKRLLDLGVYNFLMPFIESAEQARAAVAATRYPPRGIRGIAVAQRSNRYGYCPDYFQRIDDNISVQVQIESRAGVEAVREIAQID